MPIAFASQRPVLMALWACSLCVFGLKVYSAGVDDNAGASEPSSRNLVDYSPFLMPGTSRNPGSTPGEKESLELRGVMVGPDTECFWIFDTQKKAGAWVGLREQGYPFVISAADPEHDEVSVKTADGRTIILRLRDAKVNEQGNVSSSTATMASNPDRAAVPDDPKPTEAEKNWKKFEEETVRRRLARASAQIAGAGQN